MTFYTIVGIITSALVIAAFYEENDKSPLTFIQWLQVIFIGLVWPIFVIYCLYNMFFIGDDYADRKTDSEADKMDKIIEENESKCDDECSCGVHDKKE